MAVIRRCAGGSVEVAIDMPLPLRCIILAQCASTSASQIQSASLPAVAPDHVRRPRSMSSRLRRGPGAGLYETDLTIAAVRVPRQR